MAFIFIQSAFPADLSSEESGIIVGFLTRWLHTDAGQSVFIVRKTAHFLEYLVLGAGLLRTLHYRKTDGKKTSGLPAFPAASAAWLFGTFYAVTDEVHQMLVPGRSGECRDVLIDSAGVLAGILLVIIVFKIKNRKEVKG